MKNALATRSPRNSSPFFAVPVTVGHGASPRRSSLLPLFRDAATDALLLLVEESALRVWEFVSARFGFFAPLVDGIVFLGWDWDGSGRRGSSWQCLLATVEGLVAVLELGGPVTVPPGPPRSHGRCASGRPGPGGLPALGPGGGALLRKAPPPLSREALLQRPEDAPSPVGSGCCCCGGGGGGNMIRAWTGDRGDGSLRREAGGVGGERERGSSW